jgi:hypothetical protein
VLIIILSFVVAVAAGIVTADRACQPLTDCLFPVDCQPCEVPQPPSSGP